MMIFSPAYLVQSRCGRIVVVLSRHRAGSLGNWLGDLDIGPDVYDRGPQGLRCGCGFTPDSI